MGQTETGSQELDLDLLSHLLLPSRMCINGKLDQTKKKKKVNSIPSILLLDHPKQNCTKWLELLVLNTSVFLLSISLACMLVTDNVVFYKVSLVVKQCLFWHMCPNNRIAWVKWWHLVIGMCVLWCWQRSSILSSQVSRGQRVELHQSQANHYPPGEVWEACG